jgi:hypothetical protein
MHAAVRDTRIDMAFLRRHDSLLSQGRAWTRIVRHVGEGCVIRQVSPSMGQHRTKKDVLVSLIGGDTGCMILFELGRCHGHSSGGGLGFYGRHCRQAGLRYTYKNATQFSHDEICQSISDLFSQKYSGFFHMSRYRSSRF